MDHRRWLRVQVRLAPVAARHVPAALALAGRLRDEGLRVEVGSGAGRLAAQVREAALLRVPFMAVLGDREVADGTAALSRPGGEDLGRLDHEALTRTLRAVCRAPAM